MAIQTSFTTPANGTTCFHTLITALCAAGWKIPAWSDGTTLTTPGSPLSANPYGSAGSGATNLGNTNAWFRITAPDGSREWMIQRSTTDVLWTIQRSRTGFSGGSPTASTLPTDATTGLTLQTAATFFPTVAFTHRWAISLESEAPYGWFAFLVPIGGGTVTTVLFDEPMSTVSIPSADTDPVITGMVANGTITPLGTLWSSGASASVKVWKRLRHGLSGASNARVSTLVYIDGGYVTTGVTTSVAAPAQAVASAYQVGPDPASQTEFPLPIVVTMTAAPSATTGYGGICNRLRWCSVAGRNNGQTLYDSVNSLYWIFVGGMWVPWDSSQPNV